MRRGKIREEDVVQVVGDGERVEGDGRRVDERSGGKEEDRLGSEMRGAERGERV